MEDISRVRVRLEVLYARTMPRCSKDRSEGLASAGRCFIESIYERTLYQGHGESLYSAAAGCDSSRAQV